MNTAAGSNPQSAVPPTSSAPSADGVWRGLRPVAGLCAVDVPVPEGAQGHRFCMPLFHPGVKVRLNGREETVSHVVVRKQLLAVHLVGRELPYRPDQLELEPTVFSTVRKPEPLFT